jgi:hypothetical protein
MSNRKAMCELYSKKWKELTDEYSRCKRKSLIDIAVSSKYKTITPPVWDYVNIAFENDKLGQFEFMKFRGNWECYRTYYYDESHVTKDKNPPYKKIKSMLNELIDCIEKLETKNKKE